MQEVLNLLKLPDYHFLVNVIQSNINLTNDQALKERLTAYEELQTENARAELHEALEREIRYLGSSDLAYLLRYLAGTTPGVPFRVIIFDAARALQVRLDPTGSDRKLLEELVEQYASIQFASMSREEQQRLLVDLGVKEDQAASFILKSAGMFAIPALIQAFGKLVVDGLIKNIVFGAISRIIGKQLSGYLFQMLVARFPWWVRWIGPAAWTVTISWTALDLQGPALRKTVPIVLYLGLCSLREKTEE